MNYYNEFDPKTAAWLRELIKRGLLPAGDVDERSIADVKPTDLVRYTQCHFFAGIGGWSLALQLAGWPADKPVWTGSCPCQPFSSAGKQKGVEDERHLWPVFFRLIRECRPECVFGEQVASAIGHGWLDGVSADLEGEGYACGAVVLGAHSVGAPHIRQRLYWVANAAQRGVNRIGGYTGSPGSTGNKGEQQPDECGQPRHRCQDAGWVGESEQPGLEGHAGDGDGRNQPGRDDEGTARPVAETSRDGGGGVEHAHMSELDAGRYSRRASVRKQSVCNEAENPWSTAIWLPCRDGKARRVKPGLPLLAHGVPARVVRLRGYGNAIVPQVAAEFIKAFLES